MTDTAGHDWITFHRLRSPIAARSTGRVSPEWRCHPRDGCRSGRAVDRPHLSGFRVARRGNTSADQAVRGGFEGRAGFTLSLWHSDEGMLQAAYHSGAHRTQINEDKAGLLSDRTSFTRLRVIRSWGDWEGEVAWTHP